MKSGKQIGLGVKTRDLLEAALLPIIFVPLDPSGLARHPVPPHARAVSCVTAVLIVLCPYPSFLCSSFHRHLYLSKFSFLTSVLVLVMLSCGKNAFQNLGLQSGPSQKGSTLRCFQVNRRKFWLTYIIYHYGFNFLICPL